jgi:hypothetical protein
MAKAKLLLILGVLPLFCAASSFGQVQMKCRVLDGSNNFVQPNEVMVKVGDQFQACHPVNEKPVGVAAAATTTPVSTQQAAVTPPSPTPAVTTTPASTQQAVVTAPSPTPAVTPVSAPAPVQSCLIVTSAEGHRMRNSIIAGALTGGIGLAAGLIASGGRYEYRDAVNMPPADVKMKYKGGELQKLQQQGIHVVVIRKNDKQGETAAIQNARLECSAH